uniref:von Willebrand factor A domain-containing protein 5A-like n=1 Tax=Esox lucius TaxID=8010 RepID=A0A3P8Y9F7_ESOLU
MENCCGLVTLKNAPVPLKGIAVEVSVQGHVATVSSILQYENQEESPLEAVFVFPLPGEAAVCRFSAKIGQTEVVGEVQEKQKAQEQYDDALSSGQQAFLLEESSESPDVFKLSVGSLPPGEKASISLDYVTELAVQADDGLRLCLPAVLNPRYKPQDSAAGTQVSSVPAGSVPYSLSLRAHVTSPHPISKVESNCPLEPLNYLNTEKTQATVSLAAGHKFDRDVELLVYYQDAHKPTAIVEAPQTSAKPGTLMGDPVVMLSLYPEFPKDVMSSMTSRGEFLFVVDRSGSMDCPIHSGPGAQDRIGSARDTLLLLLKSLPMGCYFNIIGFGSSHEMFFPKSVEYNQKTMDEALQKVKGMSADLGGTEILQPLKHIYSQPCLPDHPRQIFLFTDGEVWNTKEVLDLVKMNSGSHRLFSFGIGEGASSALISGMAKQGGGHAQFITGQDRMQPKVMQSLRFALQPAVVDISVNWNVPKGVSVTPLSPPIRVVFQGQRALLYAQLTGEVMALTTTDVTTVFLLDLMMACKMATPRMMACNMAASVVFQSCPESVMDVNYIASCDRMDVEYLSVVFLKIGCPIPSEFQSPVPLPTPEKEPLLQLISLQKASGSWILEPALAEVLGKPQEDVAKPMPKVNQEVWATVLALVWLYGFKMEAQEEWQFLAIKAVSWIKAQKVANVSECVLAGNNLLGCQVQMDTMGL